MMLAWQRSAVSAAGTSAPRGAALMVLRDHGWPGTVGDPQPCGGCSAESPQSGGLVRSETYQGSKLVTLSLTQLVRNCSQWSVSGVLD